MLLFVFLNNRNLFFTLNVNVKALSGRSYADFNPFVEIFFNHFHEKGKKLTLEGHLDSTRRELQSYSERIVIIEGFKIKLNMIVFFGNYYYDP